MGIISTIEKDFFYSQSWSLADITRGHYFLLAHLVMAVLSLLMFMFWNNADYGYNMVVLMMWVTVPTALVVPIATLFFTQSLLIAINIMLVLHFSLYVIAIAVTGYFESPMMLLLTYIPLVALLSGSLRMAFFWTTVCLLEIVFAYLATINELPVIPGDNKMLGIESWYHFNLIFAMAVSVVLAFGYDRTLQVMADIFSQEKMAFERDTLTDSLTSLANGYQLKKAMEALLASKKPFYMLLIDSLNFDAVIEEYGHHTADKVLTLMGQKLSDAVSKHDLVARKQKDQFAIILRKLDNEQDVKMLEGLLHEKLSKPFITKKHQVFLKCRIKHCYIEEGDSPDKIEKLFIKPAVGHS